MREGAMKQNKSNSIKEWMEKTLRVVSDIACNSRLEWVEEDQLAVWYEWDALEKGKGTITLEFDIPCIDMEFAWEPTCLMNRFLNRHFQSSAVGAVPVIVYCNNAGNSICAFALSEAVKKVNYDFRVVEETARMKCRISVDVKQFGTCREFSYVLYVQDAEQSLSEACRNIRSWWNEWYPLQNWPLPGEVKEPIYSTWYSFHRELIADSIIEECIKAKEYGMDMVFVDAGWHSEVNDRRYIICGDWQEYAVSKIPDMKEFVKRIHELGMKVVLWYSVAFVSDTTKAWEQFHDKVLMYNVGRKYAVLDPRYPEVRNFLISHYVRALKEWNLDGFKLDFVDNFHELEPGGHYRYESFDCMGNQRQCGITGEGLAKIMVPESGLLILTPKEAAYQGDIQ